MFQLNVPTFGGPSTEFGIAHMVRLCRELAQAQVVLLEGTPTFYHQAPDTVDAGHRALNCAYATADAVSPTYGIGSANLQT